MALQFKVLTLVLQPLSFCSISLFKVVETRNPVQKGPGNTVNIWGNGKLRSFFFCVCVFFKNLSTSFRRCSLGTAILEQLILELLFLKLTKQVYCLQHYHCIFRALSIAKICRLLICFTSKFCGNSFWYNWATQILECHLI